MVWWLVVGLLCSCRSTQQQQSKTNWFLGALSSVSQFADSDARTQAYRGSGKGPLLVDLDALSRIGLQVAGERLSKSSITATLPSRTRDVTREQAVVCTSTPSACEVVDDGVFLQVDSLVRNRDGVRAVVTTITTDRSMPGRPGTCHRQLMIEAGRDESRWKITDTKLRSTC